MILLCSTSFAYFGARPMGMGGAFTAIADDANAAHWNPAGFALNPGVDITGSTLLTNRNDVMGDNFASIKLCYEANMSSPFEWIFGIGAISALAVDTAQYLGEQGILKKNWGRNVQKSSREESMAEQVKEYGDNATESINPIKTREKKVDDNTSRKSIFGPIQNLTINFNSSRRSYWDHPYSKDGYEPYNKAQFALGLTYLHDNNPNLDENRNWYTLSLASGWEERIAVGGNINAYDLQIISNGIKGFGAGIDVGVIAKPLQNFSLGLVAKEILTTDINWQNGAQTRYEMTVNLGAAINPIDELTISFDGHNIFSQNNKNMTKHYGIEFRPIRGLALRAGLCDNSKTAGASIGIYNFVIDYAYLGGEFNKTQIIGVTYKI